MRPATATARLLVRCVTEHPWSAPPDGAAALAGVAGPGRIAAAARFHGVSGCVHHSLATLDGADRFAEVAADHAASIDLHLRAMGDLARLAPALDALGVPWLVVKGPVLAEEYYPRPDLRTYGDLDVVVPGSALGDVLDAVEGTGAHLLDRNWPLLRELRVGELLLRLRHGTLLDLHWHLFSQAAVRRATRAPLGGFLERARPVVLGGTRVSTLDPTDTLLHVGAHGTLSGGHRLVWLKDLERVVAAPAPQWDEAVARARALGIGPAVALALVRARRLLGAPVPPGVPEAMAGGRAFLVAGRLADRLAPPARTGGNRSIAQLVSRSARADTAATAAEVRRRVTAAVAGKGRYSLAPPLNDMDPASERSPRHDAGRPDEREAFLDDARRDVP